jgi:hypothetical protein
MIERTQVHKINRKKETERKKKESGQEKERRGGEKLRL